MMMLLLTAIFFIITTTTLATTTSSTITPQSTSTTSTTTVVTTSDDDLPVYQWLYFQFHSDSMCTSFIDYVHGVRVNECQTDPKFLMLWMNTSSPVTTTSNATSMATTTNANTTAIKRSYRVSINGTSVYEPMQVWMTMYTSEDCSGEIERIDTESWRWTQECHTITDTAMTELSRHGRTLMLNVNENTRTPNIIGSQTKKSMISTMKNFYSQMTIPDANPGMCSSSYGVAASNFSELRTGACIPSEDWTYSYKVQCAKVPNTQTNFYTFNESTDCSGFYEEDFVPKVCSLHEDPYNPYSNNSSTTPTYTAEKDSCLVIFNVIGRPPTPLTTPAPTTLTPTASPTMRSTDLLVLSVGFTLTHVINPLLLNESRIYEELESYVCDFLHIDRSYCDCSNSGGSSHHECLSLTVFTNETLINSSTTSGRRLGDRRDMSVTTKANQQLRGSLHSPPSPPTTFLSINEEYLLHVNMTVTINVIDFIGSSASVPSSNHSPENVTLAIANELQSLSTSNEYEILYWTFLYHQSKFFTKETTASSTPTTVKLMSVIPVPTIDNGIHPPVTGPSSPATPSFTPTPAPVAVTKGSEFSTMEIVGLTISIFFLVVFQIGAFYLWCCRYGKVTSEDSVGATAATAGNRSRWMSIQSLLSNCTTKPSNSSVSAVRPSD